MGVASWNYDPAQWKNQQIRMGRPTSDVARRPVTLPCVRWETPVPRLSSQEAELESSVG